MTNEAKARLARYRSGDSEIAYESPYILINDLCVVLDEMTIYLKSKCDPRTNPGGHLTAYEALVIAGERPEAKEQANG